MPSTANVVKRIVLYSGAGTIASLLIAYGLREFLRATGGGYYCCNHGLYQGRGIGLAFIGWAILTIAGVNFYRELTAQ